jgi:choline dehydrogenase-like flavoprotein
MEATIWKGTRWSAANAYLRPAMKTGRVRVVRALARRVVIEGGRATGVEVRRRGAVEVIRAGREVILAASSLNSPKLLMLSGIGPADHLRALGLGVVLDQPGVGSDLQDHVDLFVIAECTGPHTYDRFAKPHLSALAGLQYLLTRRGPVASSLFETGGFWYADPAARSPDIQLHLGLGSGIEAGVAAMPNGGVTLNSAYLRPRSRGTVRLASADPGTAPLIDPNYWEDPYDREMSIRGLKLAREIMRQKALKRYVLAERLPGPDVVSDEDCVAYACRHAKTDHHPAGTCRMGSDAAAVVDPRLRFNGIDGLRVADASVMPRLVSSNTNAPTIMIAEKAADMIRADRR